MMSNEELIEMFSKSIKDLTPTVTALIDKLIIFKDGVPEFDYVEAYKYWIVSAVKQEPTREILGAQAAMFITSAELIAHLKIMKITGVDEAVILKNLVDGKRPNESEILDLIEKIFKEKRNAKHVEG